MPLLYRLDKILEGNSQLFENGHLQNVKSDFVIQKARSEVLSQGDFHSDDMLDITEKAYQNKGYIQFVRRSSFRNRGRSAHSIDVNHPKNADSGSGDPGNLCNRVFLQIKPALPGGTSQHAPSLGPRSNSTLGVGYLETRNAFANRQSRPLEEPLTLQSLGDGRVQLVRSTEEKERMPDRISLDRRGLLMIPNIVGENELRLLSFQHNLVNSLMGLASLDLTKLVFLDVYDNQIEKITSLEGLPCLRVLLMGKNRIRKMEGLTGVIKLEVLDLHGNRINRVAGLQNLKDLKVLNLAGNQIRCIGTTDLQGLGSIRELNLKRNRLRKLLGFATTPKLQKLFLSNNDLQNIEDMCSLALATCLREVTLDGNPVALGGDCVPFLVSYLPSLTTLTNMAVTEQVRHAANAWRRHAEAGSATLGALGGCADAAARRDQVIDNARTNWELLRSQSKCFNPVTSTTGKDLDLESGFVLEATSTPIQNDSKPAEMTSSKLDPNFTSDLKQSDEQHTVKNVANVQNLINNIKLKSAGARRPCEKRVNFSERSMSQDTDASHSTSTSSELLKLPPILLPILSSLEKVKLTQEGGTDVLRRWESVSSVGPAVDSSLSSLPSSSSDEEGDEARKKPVRRIPTALRRRANFSANRSKSVGDSELKTKKQRPIGDSEIVSNISNASTNVGSIIANSSTSGSDKVRTLKRDSPAPSGRNIRSATLSRRANDSPGSGRASTARMRPVKQNSIVHKSETIKLSSPCKDRDQGTDYLVEVAGGEVSVWGGGALRQMATAGSVTSADLVQTAHFHYAPYPAIAASLPRLKTRFHNVSEITFRATGLQYFGQLHALAELRGLRALRIHPEGNPIVAKRWKDYALYRLAHWGLKVIDNAELSEANVSEANACYAGLSDIVVRALPDAPLQPLLARLGRNGTTGGGNTTESNSEGGARKWLRSADPALREVVAKEALQWKRGNGSQEDMMWRNRGRAHLAQVISLACGAAERLRLLEQQWPTFLHDLIYETLLDFNQMDIHVKEMLRETTADL